MHRPPLLTAVLRALALVLGLGLLVTPASAAGRDDGAARRPGDGSSALLGVLQDAVRQGSPGALAQSRTGRRVRDLAAGVADTASAGPRIEEATDYNPSFAAGNGDMVSTVGDLDRFDSALLGGKLLPARLLRAMLTPTPGSFPNTDVLRYGLGVVIARTPCGVTVYGNAGSIQGYETWMSATPDGRHTMSFVLNQDWLDPTDIIVQAITAEFCPR
ncbi:serine hydrolase [Streptomyces bungoensis]|uniref:serine hydrolase n=1 Tax=Streptomyces bungoensis TaxID=285568 RepID=UPI00099E84AA|nr:serine hydrolase [Streptomyces bungoensis]